MDSEQPDNLLSDAESFSNMVINTLGMDELKVSKMYHLGKKVENKSRHLLVSLETLSMKRTLLSKSAILRKSEHWKDVFVSPDLTPKERKTNRLLRTELKRRKSAGEQQNLIIRRGKIVVSIQNPETDSHQTNHSTSKLTSN